MKTHNKQKKLYFKNNTNQTDLNLTSYSKVKSLMEPK